MLINKTNIRGVYTIDSNIFYDERGSFIKTFNFDVFKKKNLIMDFKESFYSVSKKDVLRGMHFQTPPYDHIKLVYVVRGEILDVALDIETSSPTLGKFYTTKLSEKNGRAIYLDKGIAHGFLTLSEEAIVVYITSSVYSQKHDTGIRWNSFGFNWGIIQPTMSLRDLHFNTFQQYCFLNQIDEAIRK